MARSKYGVKTTGRVQEVRSNAGTLVGYRVGDDGRLTRTRDQALRASASISNREAVQARAERQAREQEARQFRRGRRVQSARPVGTALEARRLRLSDQLSLALRGRRGYVNQRRVDSLDRQLQATIRLMTNRMR